MLIGDYPLPIIHQYAMRSDRPAELQPVLGEVSKGKGSEVLSVSRAPMLPVANLLLKLLVEELRPSHLIVSTFGIREGLLYERLDEETRRRDPLLDAARETGRGLGRFSEHGGLLNRWIAPIFDDEPEAARLRLAAAASPTSPGCPTPISAPSGEWTWLSTAIGLPSTGPAE
jgi:exopolyphosphatase/guanosine-5'-triphosphate,3'-diphosphate pyrophosphatase